MGAVRNLARRISSGPDAPAVTLVRASSGLEARATSGLQNPASWLFDALSAGRSYTGVAVTADSALAHADVYACVRVLSDAVASLPLQVYRRTPAGREKAAEEPSARLLGRPSPMLTPATLWSTVTAHLNLHGNAYLAKLRSGQTGPVTRLWPLDPCRVDVSVADGEPVFALKPSSDDRNAGIFSRRDILHIKAMSIDGVCGLSPITQAREALGLGMALEESAAKFFANGSYPGGIIQTPGVLSDEAARRLKMSWESAHQGIRNNQRVAVLEGGAQFQATSIPPEDAQFVEQRRLSATQIARIFRVPPWMVSADSGSSMTYSNTEQQQLHFAQYSVRPWLVVIEQALACDEDLFPADGSVYPEFLMDALLRADTATRAEAYAKAIGAWMTPNEIRALENLPAMDGGNELSAPAPAPALMPQAADDPASRVLVIQPEREERMMREVLGLVERAQTRAMNELRETFQPVVNVPAPVVNVEPAQVTVNVPEQPAPQVTVNVPSVPPPAVNVNIPPDPKDTKRIDIKRDRDGRISSATVSED